MRKSRFCSPVSRLPLPPSPPPPSPPPTPSRPASPVTARAPSRGATVTDIHYVTNTADGTVVDAVEFTSTTDLTGKDVSLTLKTTGGDRGGRLAVHLRRQDRLGRDGHRHGVRHERHHAELRRLRQRRYHGGRLTSSRNRRGGRGAAPPEPGTGAFAMNAATRAASISAVVALVLAAVWLFWPAALGGGTTYVTTHGISMEPRFHTGDLAILRPDSRTRSATSSRYRSDSLDTIVMHRIVAGDGDRFVIQGDNNDWLDEDQPAAGRDPRHASSSASRRAARRSARSSRPAPRRRRDRGALAVLGAARAPRGRRTPAVSPRRPIARVRCPARLLDADPGARPAGRARCPQPWSLLAAVACGVLLAIAGDADRHAHRRR